MTRPNRALLAIAAAVATLCVCLLVWHHRANPSPVRTAPTMQAAGPIPTAPLEDTTPTLVYGHNVRLLKGPNFRIYISWLRGQMLRTHGKINPSLDDPDSFVFEIQKGVIRVNIGDFSNFLNISSPSNAPLKGISLQPAGETLKLRGTLHKIIALPIELDGKLSPTPDGRVQLHVNKISVLKIPMKGLLGTIHVEISDLVHSSNVPGIQISGNDLFFDTERLLPPPHIHGQITSVRIRPPDVEIIYGNAGDDESRLAQWHNFLRLTDGTIDFGKLTMHNVDLTMIDVSREPWFNLDLVNYQAQLINGYTRMTPHDGLEIFMPNADEPNPKKKMGSVSLDWLKNRNDTLPPGVPLK